MKRLLVCLVAGVLLPYTLVAQCENEWVQQISALPNGMLGSQRLSIALDGSNNVYMSNVIANAQGLNTDDQNYSGFSADALNNSAYVARFLSSGQFSWLQIFEGDGLMSVLDISADDEGNVYGLPGTLAVGIESNVMEQMMFGASLRAYPNPSTGNIQIEYDLPFGKQAKLQVSDELGRTVQTLQLPSHQGTYTLEATTLGTGIYFCSLISGVEVLATQKLSVIRNE